MFENSSIPFIMQSHVFLFSYMWRRCEFLEKFPGFVYNTGFGEYIEYQGRRILSNTEHLGSTLMEAMLEEVSVFCNSNLKGGWGERPHQQVLIFIIII